MLYRLVVGLCLLCGLHTASAQSNIGPAGDAVYLANGSRFKNAQIVEITDERVKFTVKHGDMLTNHNYGRDLVLMSFTQEGNFLIIDQVSKDRSQADQQLKDFLMAPARSAPTDIMVRRVPLEVLRGIISYESEEVVNYQPVSGGAASISKNELMVILYRDGKHQVLSDFTEAAPILAELRPQLLTKSAPAPAPVAVVETPAPVTAPAEQPVAATTRPNRPTPSRPTSTPAPTESADPRPAPASGTKAALSDDEYVTYRAKAVQRVDDFVSYIGIITDKSLSSDDKDRAIEEAKKLFLPDATIEVTSANKATPPRRMSISTYLSRLKLLPYTYTEVTWSDVQYVKELTQAPDGDYYGIIAGKQKFKGFGKGNRVDYEDVTDKNVRVKLKSYQKTIDGQNETNWQVLLGSVGVGSSQ
ncbi:hypothetical protein [uncultured Fibrella sp.]|uniref:hypothetical protein n=1 Tax=uncultured Fibrella sp. TaxID=1284596 RepID=UPI0035CCA474